MNINQFHKKYRKITESPSGPEYTRQMVPYVVCKDGFTLSVQASYTHYCSPREVDADFYDEFEIGFPSEEEHLLMPFCENEEQPTQTVYGFVPVKVVDRVLAKHGGIDEDATLTRSKQDGMA